MSHIQLNYASLLFWSIFVGSHWELFFLDIIVTIAEMSTEILRKFVFLTMFEKCQILWKIWMCLNKYFWPNQVKEIYINKNCFAPQSEPHNAEIHRELFFLDIKVSISEMSTEILRKFVFLTLFERVKPWGKFVFV